jgi:Zn-dependent peptidase ImmA (M78 family)
MKKPQIKSADASSLNLSSAEIVKTLLVESGTILDLPTDQHKLFEFLGLKQLSFDFMNELEFLDDDHQPARDLRAALSLNDRIVAIQSDLSEKRSRFSALHEVAHFILPEHHEKLFLDDDETLSWWTRIRLEREANQVAADLLFQGNRFTREAIDHQVSWRSILELAPKYGASYEAAGRRFTEGHVLPCALLVYEKISKTNEVDFEEDVYRLQYTIASKPFQKQFFRNVKSEPNRFVASELYKPKFWGATTEGELVVENDEHSKWHFDTEVFSNSYKIFQLAHREKGIK